MSLMHSGMVLAAWEDKTSLEFGLRTSSKMRTNYDIPSKQKLRESLAIKPSSNSHEVTLGNNLKM